MMSICTVDGDVNCCKPPKSSFSLFPPPKFIKIPLTCKFWVWEHSSGQGLASSNWRSSDEDILNEVPYKRVLILWREHNRFAGMAGMWVVGAVQVASWGDIWAELGGDRSGSCQARPGIWAFIPMGRENMRCNERAKKSQYAVGRGSESKAECRAFGAWGQSTAFLLFPVQWRALRLKKWGAWCDLHLRLFCLP